MRNRIWVLLLALTAALAFALPAVGAPGPADLAKRAFKIGKKADRKATAAKKQARQARKAANRALKSGQQAQSQINAGVPRAKQADVAAALEGLAVKPFRVRVTASAAAADVDAAREAATPVELFSMGSIRIYAKCFVDTTSPSNPVTTGEIYLASTAQGVVYSSPYGDSSNGYFDPAKPEYDRKLGARSSSAGPDPGNINISDAEDDDFYILAPDVTIQGDLHVAAKVGNPAPGTGGVFGSGNACIFSGLINAH